MVSFRVSVSEPSLRCSWLPSLKEAVLLLFRFARAKNVLFAGSTSRRCWHWAIPKFRRRTMLAGAVGNPIMMGALEQGRKYVAGD